MAKVLKDEAYKAISNDNQLMADVADALDIAWSAMPMMLQRRSRRFTEFPAVKLIADFLHCEIDDLLIEDTKVESKA